MQETKEPQFEIGGLVYQPKAKECGRMHRIHKGKCPKCNYDRVYVHTHTIAGVSVGHCCNPLCDYKKEL